MDPIRNPFAPGAGTPPPELAGRSDILERADVALHRVRQGRAAKGMLLIGLRGVGKTVLLNRIQQMADEAGFKTVFREAHEDKPLADLLVPPLKQLLLSLAQGGGVSEIVMRGLRVLKSFAGSLKVRYGALEVGIDVDPEPGSGDSGDIENDLPDLLAAVAEAGLASGVAIVLVLDELQYLSEVELSALIMGMHRIAQRRLPLVLFGAGLPQLVGTTGRSKSYAERLFDFPDVGPLQKQDAEVAISEPIAREGERIAKDAVECIIAATQGYPYFLQEWGYQCWDTAEASPIAVGDVDRATPIVLRKLDESFFRVRLDRLARSEKRYLRAMAELGAGPHRSGDIADVLEVKAQSVAPVRNALIKKGMIYSPQQGDTAFTVPLFDAFLRRQMPL